MLGINKKNKEKGFTLIELMIVVAIIGILAAIAIPQFASYRLKAFNSSAVADARNGGLAEEGLYSDYTQYGSSSTTGVAGTGGIGALVSSTSVSPVIAATAVGQEQTLSISNNVSLMASAGAGTSVFTITAKHKQGDRLIAVDGDASGVYWSNTIAAGTAMVAGDAIAATLANDPLAAAMTAL